MAAKHEKNGTAADWIPDKPTMANVREAAAECRAFSTMNDADCVAFLRWALPRMNMRWRGFRKVRRQVCKRIARRMRELELERVEDYRHLLETDTAEWQVLDTFCRITISRFYRDHNVFVYLGDEVLPRLAEDAAERGETRLRCWSAGCASGEEAYTTRIVWLRQTTQLPRHVDLHIVGTDADPHMIERARRGCYAAGTLRELPPAWIEEYFDRVNERFCVSGQVREGTEFRRQDIRSAQPQGPFDLILCRNLVFTYFAEETQRNLLDAVIDTLSPKGVLVIGKQETLPDGFAVRLSEWAPHTGSYRRISR